LRDSGGNEKTASTATQFLKHLVNVLAELAALGVALVCLRDNRDLSTFDATKHGCKNEATVK